MADSPIENTTLETPAVQNGVAATKRTHPEEAEDDLQQSKRQRIASKEEDKAIEDLATTTQDQKQTLKEDQAQDDVTSLETDAAQQQQQPANHSRPEIQSEIASPVQPTSEKLAAPNRKRPLVAGVVDEKQRSRRLFGSLLGTIGQVGDNRTSKKRQEIEARRKAEVQRDDDAFAEDRRRKMGQLRERRQQDQRQVDEVNMKIRHRNMRDSANFLRTRTEPSLYYRPWDLRPSEEDRIDDQKRDVEVQIDDELDAFYAARAESRRRRSSSSADERAANGDEKEEEENVAMDSADRSTSRPISQSDDPTAVKLTDVVLDDPATTTPEVSKESLPPEDGSKPELQSKHTELEDEHMEEGDEDNVIY